ncbi:MAG: hypothetical protein JXQ72_14865 [Anaerolineae bacterium]|nr:hypothetical protein [Anaerolineae bacterium]
MSYTIEQYSGQPILISTLREDYNPLHEIQPMVHDLAAILDAAACPMILIVEVQFQPDDAATTVGAPPTNGNQNELFRHPNLREIIFVSDDGRVHLRVGGWNATIYRNVNVCAFHTIDAALAYAESVA